MTDDEIAARLGNILSPNDPTTHAPSPAAPLDLGPIRARLEAIANGVSADTLVTLDNGASWQPKGAQEFSEAIAHAPADIAALVAEVERLRAENLKIKGILGNFMVYDDPYSGGH